MAIYTRTSRCSPVRAEEGLTGVLCPPGSSTKFRDLPAGRQIGGYPKPGQLSGSVDEATLDSEGRCVILEFPAFVLIGVYSPATRDETRAEFRQAFLDALDVRVRNLVSMGKQVFLCGDLNIIRSELDTAGLAERLRKEAMTLDEFISTPARRFLNQLVFGGRVIGERDRGREDPVLWDLCREFHPARAGMYTCWETRKNARPGNFGNRIDYVLCSSAIKDWFIDANIQEGLLGSDHCPVYATLGDVVSFNGAEVHIEDIMNPSGMFKDGKRLRDWSSKDLLPMSAKLLPEFDRRQSIRDMFSKKATPSVKATPTPALAGNPEPSCKVAETALGKEENNMRYASPSSNETTAVAAADSIPSSSTTSAPPQKMSLIKRQAEPLTMSDRPQKKGKTKLSRASSAQSIPTPGLSQSSLKGFFSPTTPAADIKPVRGHGLSNERSTEAVAHNTRGVSSDPDDTSKEVFDPIQAKESWSKLLSKRAVPKCEHGEDCQMLVTRKAGVNCGTSLFVCLDDQSSNRMQKSGVRILAPSTTCHSIFSLRAQIPSHVSPHHVHPNQRRVPFFHGNRCCVYICLFINAQLGLRVLQADPSSYALVHWGRQGTKSRVPSSVAAPSSGVATGTLGGKAVFARDADLPDHC